MIIAQSTESFSATNREQLYVSVSRGRTQCSLYTDDAPGLLEAVTGTGDNRSMYARDAAAVVVDAIEW